MDAVPEFLSLKCAVVNAQMASDEEGVSIQAWTSLCRFDTPVSQVDITSKMKGQNSSTFVLPIPIASNIGTKENPWPEDAEVWFEAHTTAPSVESAVVGGRAGSASVSLWDIRSMILSPQKYFIDVTLRMPQLPTPEGGVVKMWLRLMGPADDMSVALAESFLEKSRASNSKSRFSFTPRNTPFHDEILKTYAGVHMYPYSEHANRNKIGFQPSHKELEQIHCPFWVSTIVVPMWAFWIQTTRPIYDDNMKSFLVRAAEISLERHNITREEFLKTVTKQLQRKDAKYSDKFTYMVAATMDACAVLATSTFYRYDEEFEVEQRWLRKPKEKKTIVESFHDALREAGGDCEDLGSLIHRVFRWLQMGDPAQKDPGKYWNEYGGWGGSGYELLDAMQHMMYWYVSGGSLGSVTSARFEDKGPKPEDLFIDSKTDRELDQGGHMWQEALPVTKVEELMRRMNPDGVPNKALRPKYPGEQYPEWIKYMPHTVGEGTGSIYPLVLPLPMYMHSPKAKKAAKKRHANINHALDILQSSTKVLRHMQFQRFSTHIKPVPNARVNLFYRQTTQFTTDDMALHGIPRFDLIWTLTSPRVKEEDDGNPSGERLATTHRPHLQPSMRQIQQQQQQQQQRQKNANARVGIKLISVPGGVDIDSGMAGPTWGVDMRDKLIALNLAHNNGENRQNVAFTVSPELTTEEILSFKARIKHLSPWRQPTADATRVEQIRDYFYQMTTDFIRAVDGILGHPNHSRRKPSTCINIVFRRMEFSHGEIREKALQDIQNIREHISKVAIATEVLDTDIYNVRLSLWIVDAE